jgi:site-specific recombinase XerD
VRDRGSDDANATLNAPRHLAAPYVFCEPTAPVHARRVKDIVPWTCSKAALAKRLTTDDRRHTFASHPVMRGGSLMAAKELLGHESIEMTLRYSHLTPDVKREVVRLLDGPAAGDIRETGEG